MKEINAVVIGVPSSLDKTARNELGLEGSLLNNQRVSTFFTNDPSYFSNLNTPFDLNIIFYLPINTDKKYEEGLFSLMRKFGKCQNFSLVTTKSAKLFTDFKDIEIHHIGTNQNPYLFINALAKTKLSRTLFSKAA